LRVNFWDLSGQPEFFDIRNEFYKDAQSAILVYDAGSRKSFEELEAWIAEAAKYGAKDLPVVVCCNKVCIGGLSIIVVVMIVVVVVIRACVVDKHGNDLLQQVDKGKRVVSEYEGLAWAKSRGYR